MPDLPIPPAAGPGILLWTPLPPAVASARLWYHDMAAPLRGLGARVSLNRLDLPAYDVALLHLGRPADIARVLEHSPGCRIGVMNQGEDYPPGVIANTDFIVTGSFPWEERALALGRRVESVYDYPPDRLFTRKVHANRPGEPLVLGYCGNPVHFERDFFPHGAAAVRRLAREVPLRLRVVTNGAERLRGCLPGVEVDPVEWNLETFEAWVDTFDIGVNPSMRDFAQLADPDTRIRNSNRVRSLLLRCIPSVASPLPQSTQELQHGRHVLWAVEEAGWFHHLSRLAASPELRQEIGDRGRDHVLANFGRDKAARDMLDFLTREARAPAFPRAPHLLLPPAGLRGPRSAPPLRRDGSGAHRPWLIRHPPASAATLRLTGRAPGAAAAADHRGTLVYRDPFAPGAFPDYAPPRDAWFVAPDRGATHFDAVFRDLLEGRRLKPGALVVNRPRLARRVAIESAWAHLLAPHLARRFGCRVELAPVNPEAELAHRLAGPDTLADLLAQPALIAGPAARAADWLNGLSDRVDREAAAWWMEQWVPAALCPGVHLPPATRAAWETPGDSAPARRLRAVRAALSPLLPPIPGTP